MNTTLNEIRNHRPCQEGWTKLLKALNKTRSDDEPLSLLTVLDSNGLADAIWCLRTEPTPERTWRFALAVARRTQHLHPQAKATLDIVERYHSAQATKEELDAAVDATYAAVDATYAAVDATYAADDATYAATYATYAAAHAAAAHAAAAHAAAAHAAAAHAAEREAQVQIFREIFA